MKENEEQIESIITIRDKYENGVVTRSVEENGELYYSQTKPVYLMHEGTQTFLDDFLERFNTCYSTDKTTGNAGNIVCDGGDLFYFISKRRLQSLNFKQKFFHFLLKHIFLHGKPATIENIKSLCVNGNVNK